jgi:hypothetical protein
MRYTTAAERGPNRCMECGESCRLPKRFCSDSCHKLWLSGPELIHYPRGVEQVAAERKRLGITLEALEFKRKLSLERAF